jgi:hypothetical protein
MLSVAPAARAANTSSRPAAATPCEYTALRRPGSKTPNVATTTAGAGVPSDAARPQT